MPCSIKVCMDQKPLIAPALLDPPIPQTSRCRHSDNLFTGSQTGILVQRSIRTKKLIKHYGRIVQTDFGDFITIIIKTPLGKHVIIGSHLGVLIIVNLKTHRIVATGEQGGAISALTMTSDGAYLFVASHKDIVQFNMETFENVKEFK
jgi:hypothetical protein